MLNTSETIEDRVVDKENQILGVVNDVEYRDPEYPSIKDTDYNPLNLKGL